MSKKPMTWMDVIKEQLAKMRKEGKSPSIGDVTPAAKKEWAEIKSGKHPLYSQGSSKGRSKSNKQSKGKPSKGKQSKGKTQKMSSNSGMDHQYRIEQMLKKVHLCKKCESKIHKHMKTMKMQKGGDCGCSQSGGGSSCSTCQEGGKKGRRTMKIKGKKGKKGKKGMKGGYVSIVGTDGLEDGSEETDGTQEKVEVNEGEDV